jgi:hypothetical protein
VTYLKALFRYSSEKTKGTYKTPDSCRIKLLDYYRYNNFSSCYIAYVVDKASSLPFLLLEALVKACIFIIVGSIFDLDITMKCCLHL